MALSRRQGAGSSPGGACRTRGTTHERLEQLQGSGQLIENAIGVPPAILVLY